MTFVLVIFVVLLIALVASAASAAWWYQSNIQPVSQATSEEVIVTITEGASVVEIAAQLESVGLIRSATAFDWYTRLNGVRGSLQAGSYRFSASESVSQIIERLRTGDVATDLITILPAQRLDQVRSALLQAGFSTEEITVALNPATHAGHPALADKPASANLEGYLYPETFQRTATTSATEVVRASLDVLAEVLTPSLKQQLLAQGLSVHDAVIMASIVEREVSSAEDRAKVAQVFLKRYKEGMMLGSDPTALYGALLAGIEPSVFADTPYNTRLYTGLPPGPINNVSRASLEALANPANTEYLYFVSGDDGNTYFSYTLEEHEALTAQYCIELCRSY
jgi:UPF0755 protein